MKIKIFRFTGNRASNDYSHLIGQNFDAAQSSVPTQFVILHENSVYHIHKDDAVIVTEPAKENEWKEWKDGEAPLLKDVNGPIEYFYTDGHISHWRYTDSKPPETREEKDRTASEEAAVSSNTRDKGCYKAGFLAGTEYGRKNP